MQLETVRVAMENAQRGSVLLKQQILSEFLKIKIGRLEFQDLKDGIQLDNLIRSVEGSGGEEGEGEEGEEEGGVG